MTYVTPEQMITLFEEGELIEATNLRDAAATGINMDKLQAACEGAAGIIDGYLMRRFTLPLNLDSEQNSLRLTLQIHAANLARNLLDGKLEEVRLKAGDAIAWLKIFSEPGNGTDDAVPGVDPLDKSGTIAFEPGRQVWNEQRFTDLGW